MYAVQRIQRNTESAVDIATRRRAVLSHSGKEENAWIIIESAEKRKSYAAKCEANSTSLCCIF